MREARTSAARRRGRRVARLALLPLVVAASGCIVEATWEPQRAEPAAEPLPDRFTLTDVACPEAGACVAVGRVDTLPHASEPVVLRQDGASWQRVPLPVAVPDARGVSCSGPDDCLVLGTFGLRYHGGALTVLPPPPLAPNGFGSALDCTTGGGCLQVDGASSAWWDGAAWSGPVPLPAGMMRADLQLSCASESSCLLVGTELGIEGWPTPGTVTSTTWDGTSWSPVVTLGHPTRPLDLDCATATACFATAGVRADYWTHLLPAPVPAEVLRWDGAAWSVEAITYPGDVVPTEPGTVSCTSARRCTVLSVAGESDPPSPTVLARWDGATWTGAATDAASPATAMACPSPTSCTAIGEAVAQRLDGTTWSSTALPGGTSPAEVFADVSCATEDDCVAVGVGWTPGAPDESPLRTPTLQRFTGDRWAAEDAGDAELRHVSCATPTSCMAAGSDLGTFWSRHSDGDGWRELPTVTDLRAGAVVGLSCPTATWCLAMTTTFSNGGSVGWVWAGGDSWSELPALPDNTGSVTGVSCAAPGDCVATSSWVGPLAHRLTAGGWTPVPGPDVPRTTDFEDVDCPTPDVCAVVGYGGSDEGGLSHVLLAVLAGGEWSVTRQPGGSAVDVDCWAADGCVAVTTGGSAGLDVWDGTRWRPVENPPGVVAPTAVSCGAPGRCEVVGAFVDGANRAPVASVVIDT